VTVHANADFARRYPHAATGNGQPRGRACAIVRVAAIMTAAMLSGCAVAMLGGAARSGAGSAGTASSSSANGGTPSGNSGTSAGRAAPAARPAATDSSIATAVRSRLGANSTLKALKIVVDTHDGIVTLKGQVNTLADKSAAQAEARAVSGVKGVNNQLTVR
jgi:hyperosmotically inducible periplasmic protein